MSQLPHFFERIPILGEWVVIHHQRFGDTGLLTVQEIKNLTDLKFWPFLSVYISVHKSVCEAIASRLTHGPKAICHELSPFSISIWICPDDLPVSSVRLQLQQQPLSSMYWISMTHILCYVTVHRPFLKYALYSFAIKHYTSVAQCTAHHGTSGIHYVSL